MPPFKDADHGDITVDGVVDNTGTGTLTFAAGEVSKTITIPVVPDSEEETGETIAVTLSNAATGIALGTATATTALVDPPPPTFALTSDAVAGAATVEGNTITYTITPSSITDKAYTFTLSTIGDTVGGVAAAASATDFSPASMTVSFAAGQTEAVTVVQTIVDDGVTEGLEGYKTSLLDSSFAAVGDSIVGLITDNPATGDTFTLTTGIDVATNKTSISGFLDAASVSTPVTTWNVTDQVTGTSATTDTMTVSVISDGDATPEDKTFSALSTTGIETITFKYVDANTGNDSATDNLTTIDASGFTGMTTLSVDGGSVVNTAGGLNDTLAFTNVATGVTLSLGSNSAALDTTATYASTGGTSDALALEVSGRNGTLTATGFETVNITSTDSTARLADLTTGTTAMTVAGTGLKIDGALDSTIKTFDASTSTGPVNVYLAPGTTLTSAKGGTSTADVLAVNALGTTTTLAGFEKLVAQATGTYNLTNAVGVTTLGVDATVGGSIAPIFTNAAATQNTISVSGGAQRTTAANATNNLATGIIDYSLKTATGTTDSVTLAIDNGGVASTSTTVGTLTLGGLKTNGVENVTVTSADFKTVTITNGIDVSAPTNNAAVSVTANGSSNVNFGAIDLSDADAFTGAIAVNFADMTGKTTSTIAGANSLTFTGGSGVDAVTNGAVADTKTQTFNLGDGNDVMTLIAAGAGGKVVVNAGAGDDTITTDTAVTDLVGTFEIDGGTGTNKLIFTAGVTSDGNITKLDNIQKIEAQVADATVGGTVISGKTIEVTSFAADAGRLQVDAGGTADLSKITFAGPNAGLIVNIGDTADIVTLPTATASNTVVFGAAPGTGNSITGFTAGDGEDILDFSAVLSSGASVDQNGGAGTAITAYVAADVGDEPLANKLAFFDNDDAGAGTPLADEAAVAALFQGAGTVFGLAADSKAIVVEGDAGVAGFKVWLIDDTQGATSGTIEADDVTLIGTINGADPDVLTTQNFAFLA